MARKPKKLTVVCDPGTSLTKILYRVGSGPLQHLAMTPQVLKLPPGTFSGLPIGIGSGKPEDNAWVRVGDAAESADGAECCVVGRLAAEYRARARIRPLKRRSLVPKLLAAVGAIALTEGFAADFDLELALLLPLSELEKEGLRSEVESAFANFWFQEQRYQVQVKRYQVLPEGMGIVYSRLRRGTLEQFQHANSVFLMFGYRNASCLVFRRGTLSVRESATGSLGFYDLIDRICTRVPGIEREELHSCIYSSTQSYYSALRATRSLRTATRIGLDKLAGQQNLSELEQAEAAATEEHWALQSEWLEDVLPSSRDLNLAVASGGTLAFIGDRLKAYLASLGVELERTETDEQELLTALEPDAYTQEYFRQINGALRFADVWGLFVAFASYRLKREANSASA